MRNLIISATLAIVFGFGVTSFAANGKADTDATPVHATTTSQTSCLAVGSQVNALIDEHLASSNISAARATFQLGVSECVGGHQTDAKKYYTSVVALLTNS